LISHKTIKMQLANSDGGYRSLSYALLFLVQAASALVLVPINVNLVLTTFLVVYIGCESSLYAQEEESETLEQKDAYWFPVTAGCVLCGLYALFKYVNKDYVNYVIMFYIFLVGVFAVANLFHGLIALALPSKNHVIDWSIKIPFVHGSKADSGEEAADSNSGSDDEDEDEDEVREGKGDEVKASINDDAWVVQLTFAEIVSVLLSVAVVAWYLSTKHWLGNNLIGIAFSIQGIKSLSVGSYKTGCILLSLLFFYDIFFVFGTPIMVAVAKNVDAPIKLLFLKSFAVEDAAAQFSMLGLGDIVLPGVFIALVLRYDAQREGVDLKSIPEGESAPAFARPLFSLCMVGYVIGLMCTLFVMYSFKAAQPALLYLVPACLGFSFIGAYVRGEASELLAYSEEVAEDDKEKKE